MVRETPSGEQKSEVLQLDSRIFQQVCSGVAKDMKHYNIKDRTLPELQPLQEAEVDDKQRVESTDEQQSVYENNNKAQASFDDDKQRVESTDEPQSVYENNKKAQASYDDDEQRVESTDEPQSVNENDNKAQSPKIEGTRNMKQRKKPANVRKRRAYCFKFLITCCLLFSPVVYGNDVPGKALYQRLSWALKVRRAATFSESPIVVAKDDRREKGTDASVEAVHQRLQRSDGALINPMNANISRKVGDKVKHVFRCPSDHCELYFRNRIEECEKTICDGKNCISGFKYNDDNLFFIASIKTAGYYRFINYNTAQTVGCLQLTLQSKGSLTSNLPKLLFQGLWTAFGFSVITICNFLVIAYFIRHP